MSIDDLDLVPELSAPDELSGDGLRPCWETFTCYWVASWWTTWY